MSASLLPFDVSSLLSERLYGSLRFDSRRGGEWVLSCEPQVTLVLKRVFAKLDQGSFGEHRLSATDATARELEWFVSRYPLDISNEDAERLRQSAELHRTHEKTIASLVAGHIPPRQFNLALPPREYQAVAATMYELRPRMLLGDDVGLGKSASFICTLTDTRMLPAIVVTQAHLTRQWQREVNKFAPTLRTHIARKGTPYAIKGGFPDVFITNYHKLGGWAETLAAHAHSICFDEAQELRRPSTIKYRAAQHIASKTRGKMGLTATPIYNYGDEIFYVLDVIGPGELGHREEFLREWCDHIGMDKYKVRDPRALGMLLRSTGLFLRRTRREVGRELPPVSVIQQFVDADLHALDRVSVECAELAKIILAGGGGRGAQWRAGGEFDYRLRQATGIAKAPYVAAFVKLLVESGEKVLLYGWHREVYKIWGEKLAEFSPVMYTGSESIAGKECAKEAFCRGETPVMMISLRAGAGLDGLQNVCHTAVFGELDWSYSVHVQNIGRLSRDRTDGKADMPVMAYFLVSDEGSDPVIAETLGIKRLQLEGINDPSEDALVTEQTTDPEHVRKLAARFLERHKDSSNR